MKIIRIYYKRIKYIINRYYSFTRDPLTKSSPLKALIKFIYINFLLYVLNREVTILYLNKIKAKIKRGDGIVGNYHSFLQESNDSIFLLHFLRADDLFLDVGANVGHYTLLAGVFSQARVIAIEPIPSTFERLESNIGLNSWKYSVILKNIGLSNEPKELVFTHQQFTTNKVSKNGKGIRVKVDTLDAICFSEKPRMIKIDVEGYEWFVLKGGMKTLESDEVKVIIIELNESGKNFGIEDEQIIDLLKTKGYKPFEYDIFNRKLKPIKFKNNSQFNTLFIKDLNFVKERVISSEKIKIGSLKL